MILKKILQTLPYVVGLLLCLMAIIIFIFNEYLIIPYILAFLLLALLTFQLILKNRLTAILLISIIIPTALYISHPIRIEIVKSERFQKYFENEDQKIAIVPMHYGTIMDKNEFNGREFISGGSVTAAPFDIKHVILIRTN